MIKATALEKRFGDQLAVDGLSFTAEPGRVTGFLGPNGAGKSTTMRMILGLDRPTGGEVTVNGRPYREQPAPLQAVGALLDAKAVDGVRTAAAHLRWLAIAGGIPVTRVDEVLELVGLSEVAGKRIGEFSLGMSQRLGIAAALLGDPPVLLFDEPVNGLDPEGIRWVRLFMRHLAREGRTVVVSSHLMSEMESTADHVVVIGRGKLIADMPMSEFTTLGSGAHVHVVSPDAAALRTEIEASGGAILDDSEPTPDPQRLLVAGMDNVAIAELASARQLRIWELTPRRASLESTFMELTGDSVEYHTGETS
jgi:ABC-2 type transport system ATP-binding protein